MQVQKQRLGALAVDRLHTRLQKNVPETLREALVPEVLVRESVLGRTIHLTDLRVGSATGLISKKAPAFTHGS